MKVKFTRAGTYAHINDPNRGQFKISDDDAAEGLIVNGLSEATATAYSKAGYCELLGVDDAPDETKTESDSALISSDSMKPKEEGSKGARKRGRGNR